MDRIEEKKKYYKKQRKEQVTLELTSFLIEGDSIGEACDKTMEIFLRNNLFIDGGVTYVYDDWRNK